MFQPSCNPILIGSLPLTDHVEAMRVIHAHTPEIPLWPQLPKLPGEGMIRQFLTGFPGLTEAGNRYWINTAAESFPGEMASFYEDHLQMEEHAEFLQNSRFALGSGTTAGFSALLHHLDTTPRPLTVKGQITGPVTMGIGVKDQHGRSIFYDDNLRDMLIKLLTWKGRWQIEELKRYAGATVPPIIFIDEPGMVSFGSSGFSGVTKEMVAAAVTEVIDGIHAAGGLAGIHICANGDWGPVLVSAADIISFDAYFYFDNFILYREQLTAFLRRGGILAWGIVPTGDIAAIAEESVDSLFIKWQAQLRALSALGISERQIMAQTLIAPSCGTGSLSRDLALKVLTMTRELSRRARAYLSTVVSAKMEK
jgi:hypothetical protein